MKKKLPYLCLIFSLVFFLNACTIHFKGKEIELDTQPPKAQFGKVVDFNDTYYMTDIDIF